MDGDNDNKKTIVRNRFTPMHNRIVTAYLHQHRKRVDYNDMCLVFAGKFTVKQLKRKVKYNNPIGQIVGAWTDDEVLKMLNCAEDKNGILRYFSHGRSYAQIQGKLRTLRIAAARSKNKKAEDVSHEDLLEITRENAGKRRKRENRSGSRSNSTAAVTPLTPLVANGQPSEQPAQEHTTHEESS